MTSGNHVWDKTEILTSSTMNRGWCGRSTTRRACPATARRSCPRREGDGVAVLNLMGRVFMNAIDDPFSARRARGGATAGAHADVVLVDMHAEATSEKIAMGWHLDGQVTAVVGTHTHVQTADEQRPARRHGLHHRRRHDRPARRRDWRRARPGHQPLPDRPAAALRHGDGHAAAARRHRHRRRRRPRHGDRAAEPDAADSRGPVAKTGRLASRRCLRCSTTPSRTTAARAGTGPGSARRRRWRSAGGRREAASADRLLRQRADARPCASRSRSSSARSGSKARSRTPDRPHRATSTSRSRTTARSSRR